MTEADKMILMVKGIIADLSPEQQENIAKVAKELHDVIKACPDANIAAIAISLFGAEINKKAER